MSDDPFQEKYLIEKLTKINDSPSGKYRITIKFYDYLPEHGLQEGTWITIIRIADEYVIYDKQLRCCCSKFNSGFNGFLTIHGEEWGWVFTGGSHVFMNLDRQAWCSFPDVEPYIVGISLSPDEQTLAISAYNFYDDSLVHFYDISTIPEAPPLPRQLTKLESPSEDEEYRGFDITWDRDTGTCSIFKSRMYCKVTGCEYPSDHECPKEHWEYIPVHVVKLQRNKYQMVIIDEWKSEKLLEQEVRDNESEHKFQTFTIKNSKIMPVLMREFERSSTSCTHGYNKNGLFVIRVSPFELCWSINEEPEQKIYLRIGGHTRAEFPMSPESVPGIVAAIKNSS